MANFERGEDELDREGDTEAVEAVGASVEEPRRRPGRRPGSPKVPGSGRKRKPPPTQDDINALLYRRGPEALARLLAIGLGEAIECSGPTGKATTQYGSLKEQMRALEIIADKLLPSLKATETTGVLAQVTSPATEAEAEAIRRALLDDMMMRVRQVEGAEGVNATRAREGLGESRFLNTSSDDTPKSYGPISDTPNPDGVTSVTDPRQIADFDRRLAAERASLETTSTTSDESNPRPGDRVELGEGHYAVFNRRPGQPDAWFCFPPNISAGHAAIKPTAEACRRWFLESTAAGQALARGLKVVK